MWKAIKRLARSLFNRAKEEVKEAEKKASEKIDDASEDVKK